MKSFPVFSILALLAALSYAAGEKPKTIIKGARMDVLKKGEVTEFRDGVTLTRGNDFMSADRMVNHEKKGLTEAWGRVYLRRRDPERGVMWEAWSEKGLYDSNESSGALWGNVFLEVRESTPTVRVTRVWADRAERNPTEGSLTFTGVYAGKRRVRPVPAWPEGSRPRPRVERQEEGGDLHDLAGETVTYFEADSRVVADGDVRVFWRDGEGGGNGVAR